MHQCHWWHCQHHVMLAPWCCTNTKNIIWHLNIIISTWWIQQCHTQSLKAGHNQWAVNFLIFHSQVDYLVSCLIYPKLQFPCFSCATSHDVHIQFITSPTTHIPKCFKFFIILTSWFSLLSLYKFNRTTLIANNICIVNFTFLSLQPVSIPSNYMYTLTLQHLHNYNHILCGQILNNIS